MPNSAVASASMDGHNTKRASEITQNSSELRFQILHGATAMFRTAAMENSQLFQPIQVMILFECLDTRAHRMERLPVL